MTNGSGITAASPSPASPGAGCSRSRHGGFGGSSEGVPGGHERRAVSPFPGPEWGDGEGSWGRGSWGLPDAVAQLKEWGFLPKPGCEPASRREDRLEVAGLCGTAPASGWVTGETSRAHPATTPLSSSHLEPGDKPARAWDNAVTPPGQAATPPASFLGRARRSSMQGRAGREFPAHNFPAMSFTGCRTVTMEGFQATGGLSTNLTATHSQPCSDEQPYKNKPGHPSQHQPSAGTRWEGKYCENSPTVR